MIRLCQAKDVPFVRQLAEECIVVNIMPTRDATHDEVRQIVRDSYANLEHVLKVEKNLVILVEEDDQTKELKGYISLDFSHIEAATGERQVFIVDLAVKPDKRGLFSTQRLMNKAARLVKARGMKYLVGVVSINNSRTLKLAQHKSLGFEIERYQICKRCD